VVTQPFDVVVVGEPLVQLTATTELRDGAPLSLGFSGDALNAAAAAAAAGARTALVARVPDDELGSAMVARIEQLGIDTSHLRRVAGQHGLYLQHADPSGTRQFLYVRAGSAGSQLCPDDLPSAVMRNARIVLASGVTCAISASARATVQEAALLASAFVYDPNWRPRLVDSPTAAVHLTQLAPSCRLVTPSWPTEARALLGDAVTKPQDACQAVRKLGAESVAVTCGHGGVVVAAGDSIVELPAFNPPNVVDQTGAGDVLTGATVARLALGDDLVAAVRYGAAAAALSLQGSGGTGYLATLDDVRRLIGGRTTVESAL
jgi:2-dehydro-3-deoxygluconokinase